MRRHEVGLPVIDLNPPPGHYALQDFHQNPFKMGEEEIELAMDEGGVGWLFGDNPFNMGAGDFLDSPMGAILALTDDNPEGLPPYNFAMGGARRAANARPPAADAGSIFGAGLALARGRAR